MWILMFGQFERMLRMKNRCGAFQRQFPSSTSFCRQVVFFFSFPLSYFYLGCNTYTMPNIHRTLSKDYRCRRETMSSVFISLIIMWSYLEEESRILFWWVLFLLSVTSSSYTFAVLCNLLVYHTCFDFFLDFKLCEYNQCVFYRIMSKYYRNCSLCIFQRF